MVPDRPLSSGIQHQSQSRPTRGIPKPAHSAVASQLPKKQNSLEGFVVTSARIVSVNAKF